VSAIVFLLGLAAVLSVVAVRAARTGDPMGEQRLTDRIASFWDGAADAFDVEPDHGLADAAVRGAWDARLRSWLPPAPSDVLDLGCGTGSLALLAVEAGHRVVAVDLSPRMVERARAKLGEAATVLAGDAADPPVGDRRFDAVLVRHLVWTLPDPGAAVERWVALLRPGGRLVLIEGRWAGADDARPYVEGAERLPWADGVAAGTLAALLEPLVEQHRVEPLDDPALWGHPIDDERYALIAVVGDRARP
jgi:SAM-dependent methyltransferase